MPSPARLFLHQGAPFAAPPAHGIRRAVRMPCMRKGFWPLESGCRLSKGPKAAGGAGQAPCPQKELPPLPAPGQASAGCFAAVQDKILLLFE